ncbi:hypothetical protein [Methylobacterium sp. JK268]
MSEPTASPSTVPALPTARGAYGFRGRGERRAGGGVVPVPAPETDSADYWCIAATPARQDASAAEAEAILDAAEAQRKAREAQEHLAAQGLPIANGSPEPARLAVAEAEAAAPQA